MELNNFQIVKYGNEDHELDIKRLKVLYCFFPSSDSFFANETIVTVHSRSNNFEGCDYFSDIKVSFMHPSSKLRGSRYWEALCHTFKKIMLQLG